MLHPLETFSPQEELVRDLPLQSPLLVVGLLLLLGAAAAWVLRKHLLVKRVLILGTGSLARELIREIEAHPRQRYAIIGLVDDTAAPGEPPLPYPLLGSLRDLRKTIDEVHPDVIIVALSDRRSRLLTQDLLGFRLRGIAIEEGVDVYERLAGKLAIDFLTPASLIFSKGFRQSRLHWALGRGLSLLSSTLGLVVLAPLLGLIALAIKLDSGGPVFFVQPRVGANGRPFNLIKFRTMYPANGPTSEWARDNCHRVTRVGKWLRKFRLDELPQFVNVLRGDMNLVGPRPHPVSNGELFQIVLRNAAECGQPIPYYSLRCMVPPGLTGWAQVHYRYANDLAEEIEKARYDLYYLKHMSFWLDLRILLGTVKVILLGRESEPAKTGRSRASVTGKALDTRLQRTG